LQERQSVPPTIYAGLAGDTDPGRFVSAGLYRCRDGGAWERIDGAFALKPEVRAIVPDPARAGSLTIATQSGVFRSDDGGDSWSQLAAPAPELAVWSLLVDPTDQETMYAGYEPCAILRTRDAGKTWERLPVTEDYPSITASPEFPKRVTAIAVDPANPVQIYASLEIGGLLRSLDGGGSWEAAIDGVYVVEDAVDLHCVVVSPAQPGVVTITTRVGTFQSLDRGRHWKKLAVPALREKGSYCRALTYAPGRPERLYLGAGNDFDGDKGALFVSDDNGIGWREIELPGPMKSTVFAVAVNARHPDCVYCATKNGGVFGSHDGGRSWRYAPLPVGAGHVFALAID
jgi:photosystem II stability/assembly factor-like uncharacterized protein